MKFLQTLTTFVLLTCSLNSQAFNEPDYLRSISSGSEIKTSKAKNSVGRLKAPITKFFNPPTYIKFVLKNKKGVFLNIKVGYIS